MLGGIYAQYQPQYTTPVPILNQINRQNYDGSYSYGYEAADGSFKLEVKLPNGEVYGKYGYRDEQGQIKEIKYGAGDRGFEPSGSDINVPPPTSSKDYSKEEKVRKKKPQFVIQPQQENYNTPRPRPPPQFNTGPQQFEQARPQYQPQPQPPQYQPQPEYQYQPQYEPQQQYNSNAFKHQQQPSYHPNQLPFAPDFYHPALKNLDLISGSYSLDYSGRK